MSPAPHKINLVITLLDSKISVWRSLRVSHAQSAQASHPFLSWFDWIIWGDISQVWALTTSPWKKIGKKVTTTVLYKDENFLWFGFYRNQSRHGNITTPLCFLFIFVFLCTRSFANSIFLLNLQMHMKLENNASE